MHMNFSYHTGHLCNKASRQLNGLLRIHRLLDEGCKIALVRSFILSNFNYSPLTCIWHSAKQTTYKIYCILKKSTALCE